ncbi:MAG TPA: RNA methyltransferase [Pirellulaceae bacterium]|nr:RNA methyltransferase [Pirellulaceae bacterium]
MSDNPQSAIPNPQFVHQRHKPPSPLTRPRELIVACAPMRSNVNLSNILRTAGCCGIRTLIACGSPKIVKSVARDGADEVQVEVHRTLPPVLKELKAAGYFLVGLEQATNSVSLHTFQFPRKCALVLGNERLGLTEEELKHVDACVEIPVWGLPFAYNVATSCAMALYEYCKQWQEG